MSATILGELRNDQRKTYALPHHSRRDGHRLRRPGFHGGAFAGQVRKVDALRGAGVLMLLGGVTLIRGFR